MHSIDCITFDFKSNHIFFHFSIFLHTFFTSPNDFMSMFYHFSIYEWKMNRAWIQFFFRSFASDNIWFHAHFSRVICTLFLYLLWRYLKKNFSWLHLSFFCLFWYKVKGANPKSFLANGFISNNLKKNEIIDCHVRILLRNGVYDEIGIDSMKI